jgi:hypothetical protein
MYQESYWARPVQMVQQTSYWLDRLEFESQWEIFSPPNMFRPVLGSNQPPNSMGIGVFPPRVMQLKCAQLKHDINHSLHLAPRVIMGAIPLFTLCAHMICMGQLYSIKPILAKLIQQYSC